MLSVLFESKAGSENAFIDSIWDSFETEASPQATIKGFMVNVKDIFDESKPSHIGYHKYTGSYTTPPCREGDLRTARVEE